MALRNLIQDISSDWPNYRIKGRVDKNAHIFDLVINKFPDQLKDYAKNASYLNFHGSTGQGNITSAPWIATFDTRVTESAERGYYVVYLFSIDLKNIFLELGFGTQQFKDQFSKKNERYEWMRFAAKELQGQYEKKLLPLFKDGLINDLSTEPINLAASHENTSHQDYEQSTIYSVKYAISNLPSEANLIEDYNSFLRLYEEIILDPFTPSMEDLFEWAVNPIDNKQDSAVTLFVPRSPKRKKNTKTHLSTGRRSKEPLKVGNAGEMAVLKSERKRLIKIGRRDLAEKIIHESAQSNKPGWDITSFNEKGEKIFIEVKSTTSKKIDSIELTSNEWKAASNPKIRDRYYLYLVTEVLRSKSPPIEILKNPWAYVDKGGLEIKPMIYELSLKSSKSNSK